MSDSSTWGTTTNPSIWTTGTDAALSEMMALMTEPNWTTDSAILGRVQALQQVIDDARVGSAQAYDTQVNDLLTQYETAYNAANTANETRYQDLLSGYQNISDTQLGSTSPYSYGSIYQGYQNREQDLSAMFNQYGQQAATDISNVYDQQAASAEQDLTSRGLGNTTIQSSVSQGLASSEAQDLSRLQEELAQMNVGLQSQWTGDTLNAQTGYANAATGLLGAQYGVMERRTDVAPSLADIANLSLQLGGGSQTGFPMSSLTALMSYSDPLSYGSTSSLYGY